MAADNPLLDAAVAALRELDRPVHVQRLGQDAIDIADARTLLVRVLARHNYVNCDPPKVEYPKGWRHNDNSGEEATP